MYNTSQNQNYTTGIIFMKKIFALLLLTISLYSQDIKIQNKEFPTSEMTSQNQKIVQMVVKEISNTLPQNIDKYTDLVDIKAQDTTMLYYFEINTGSKSDENIQKQDHNRMRKAVTMGLCQSSKRFLEAQINISYIYNSAKTKVELFRFDISQKDCIGL